MIIILIIVIIYAFFIFKIPQAKQVIWGVNFSKSQAEFLRLDWKKAYLGLLEDLGAKHIKLITNWNLIENKKDHYDFSDVDWQIKETEKYGADLIYVVGIKTGRWPECYIPDWAKPLSKSEQQEEILTYLHETVLRYKDKKSIVYWQVENEPLFNFGICPWYDKKFLSKEVQLVKSLDPTRQVIVSDSGELSVWLRVAPVGDILGITMYRNVWAHITNNYGFYWESIFPPITYWAKAKIVNIFFHKKVVVTELQAEPWVNGSFLEVPMKEQEKTMDLDQFRENIVFAKKTGFDTFYLWGSEWWYWMKEEQGRPEIWNEVKKLLSN